MGTTALDLNAKIDRAISIIGQFNGAVVALSAGVDSSLVALLAKKALGDRVVAATAVSESLPSGELDIAKRTAMAIGVKHVIVETDELRNEKYASNPSNRCYYCKETLYRELTTLADEVGFEAILDGTQLDDLSDERPGLDAAREAGVKSPLLLASFSKAEVRSAAEMLGLSVWDKPAMPCLSSRIAHGERVTAEKLSMVGEAESFIRDLTGVRDLRVRHQGGLGRIEVSPEERHLLYDEHVMDTVDEHLRKLGFSSVAMDLRGYKRRANPIVTDSNLVLPVVGG